VEKRKGKKTHTLRSIDKQSGEPVESVLKKKRKVLSLEWKSEGVVDDGSGELMEPMGEMPLVGLGKSELERLVCGW